MRGLSHVREGTPGQDRTGYRSQRGVQALCLADGAGSATHSDIGAQAVVDAGCSLLVENFETFASEADGAGVKQHLLHTLRNKLEQVASRHDVEPGALACTFLCVAVSAEQFIGAHIGDGVIGYQKDGALRVVSRPDNGEFANRTTFVTSPDAASSMRLFRGQLTGISGFVLMSDGAGESLYNPRTGELAPACAKLITSVGLASGHRKNSAHRKRLRRFTEVPLRNATRDDCAVAIFGR
ncbi:PP2C family serine/threonine-protein phosphatase [Microbacterium marinum]|uniref:PP2C family serine/threonine-protein phosphatase n=1 Tax=Microbacterium marinum TaxID=421115 RepID=UPI0031B60CA0